MKQLQQNMRTGTTNIIEVPKPTLRPGMALIKTAASLVSTGTERMLVDFAERSLVGKARSRPDLVRQLVDKAKREGILGTVEAAFNRLDQPMPLGYSSSGTIIAVADDLQGYKVGDRVACAGGGYAVHAEYATIPANLLAILPDAVSFEAAAFTTLGAIALHGFRLAQPQIGESVAIIGLGLLGLLAVTVAQAAGCQVFGIDLDEQRVNLAESLGAKAVLRPQAEQAALAFSRGNGVDTILICADSITSDPVELAGAIARDRGRIVAIGAVGLNIPRKVYYEKELSFINSRSYGPGRYDPKYEEYGQDYPIGYVRWTEGRNLQTFVDLIGNGQIDVTPLISHRYPLDQATQAYDLITGKTGEPFLGVILSYPDQPTGDSPLRVKIEKLTPPSSDRPIPRVDVVRLGVIGAGNFATAVMLPAIRKVQQIERVAICSATGLHAQHAAEKYNFGRAAASEAEILEDPQINTIAILTRHDLHSEQVLCALKAGKHVYCEKPLAITLDQLEDIRKKLVEIPGSPQLMVGFNRRFSPMGIRLAEFLSNRSEPLAAHYRVNAGYLPLTHWVHDPKQGGGRIIGEACHFVDFLTFLIGKAPEYVTVNTIPDRGRYREDNVVMTFAFPDGSIGTVTYLANGDKSFSKELVEVFCGGKVAVLDDFRALTLVENGSKKVIYSRGRQDKGHQAEWLAFSRSLCDGGPPPIPYEHLFGVMEATFAAVRAIHEQSGAQISPIFHPDK